VININNFKSHRKNNEQLLLLILACRYKCWFCRCWHWWHEWSLQWFKRNKSCAVSWRSQANTV